MATDDGQPSGSQDPRRAAEQKIRLAVDNAKPVEPPASVPGAAPKAGGKPRASGSGASGSKGEPPRPRRMPTPGGRSAHEDTEDGSGSAPPGSPSWPAWLPIIPLGVNAGVFFYLDARGQLRTLAAKDHGRLVIQDLFGLGVQHLYETWPKWKQVDSRDGKEWVIDTWRAEAAAEAMMVECSRKGLWDVFGRARGAGLR